MRETVEVTVNDRPYQITQMEPFKSFRILTRLTKMAAPVAGRLAGSASGGKKDVLSLDLSGDWFVGALKELADGLDEAELEKTIKELLSVVLTGDGKSLSTLYFSGEVPHMLAVAAKVLEVEYGGFLPLIASLKS